MASTVYHINTVDTEGTIVAVGTKSKKAQALELAEATHAETKLAVQVVTGSGKMVHEVAATRKIRMSPRYSKVQALPEGVALPEDANGLRVAYVRPRSNGAVLHDAESGEYRILDLAKGKLIRAKFETTRAAGAYISEGVGARRKELAEARAEAATDAVSDEAAAELANA